MDLGQIEKRKFYRMICMTMALALIFIIGFLVLKPFIPALLLSLIFAMATWPAFSHLERRLKGRTTMAAALMTVALSLVFIVPLLLLGNNLADNITKISDYAIETFQNPSSTAPVWLSHLPVIGQYTDSLWTSYVEDSGYFTAQAVRYSGPLSQFILKIGASTARGISDLTIGVIITFFFFRHGARGSQRINILIDRFFGPEGRHILEVSKHTVVATLYGMIGTAMAQSTIAGIGFWIAGVPNPVLLAFLTFVTPPPIGAPLVWIPAALWLLLSNHLGMGIFMLLWGIFGISLIDNVVRPLFISMGTQLPFSIILFGILGGLISFGYIGLFIGPTVLAIIYTLFKEWTQPSSVATSTL